MSYQSPQSPMSALLPDDLRAQLPPLLATENVADPLVIVKFFTPDAGWTWYALEFDGDDLFWGYVVGDAPEVGTFLLSEVSRVRGPFGLRVERDCFFIPTPLSVVRRWHEGW